MKENKEVQIMQEVYKALQILGADMELLGAVGSFRDTLEDDDVLELLIIWNKTH